MKNMPHAAVEVVSPEFEVIDRFMLGGGSHREVGAPEGSFVRVSLPSGKRLILRDRNSIGAISPQMQKGKKASARGDSDAPSPPRLRPVYDKLAYGPGNVLEAEVATPASLSRGELAQSYNQDRTQPPAPQNRRLRVANFANVSLVGDESIRSSMSTSPSALGWDLVESPLTHAAKLQVVQDNGVATEIVIPATTRRIRISGKGASAKQPVPSIKVRLTSCEPASDSILTFLMRGDMHAAEAMSDWVDEAKDLLADKISDPYSAAVGGYLLLRTQKLDRLSSWVRNLADMYTWLPDGAVIHAWQLIRKNPNLKAEAEQYLLRAANAGLPVYTVGLRMLLDGLRLVGEPGHRALSRLQEMETVLWQSPVTATLTAASSLEDDSRTATFDIAYQVKG